MKQSKTLIIFKSHCRNVEYLYTLKHVGDEIVLFATNGEITESLTWDESFIESAYEVVNHLRSKPKLSSFNLCSTKVA